MKELSAKPIDHSDKRSQQCRSLSPRVTRFPRKNGPGITQPDILVINKTDLTPYAGASLEVMEKDSKMMRGDKPFAFTNCKTGVGIADLATLIKQNVLFDLTLDKPHAHNVRQAGVMGLYDVFANVCCSRPGPARTRSSARSLLP